MKPTEIFEGRNPAHKRDKEIFDRVSDKDCVVGFFKEHSATIAVLKTARKYMPFILTRYRDGRAFNELHRFKGEVKNYWSTEDEDVSLSQALALIEKHEHGVIVSRPEFEKIQHKLFVKGL